MKSSKPYVASTWGERCTFTRKARRPGASASSADAAADAPLAMMLVWLACGHTCGNKAAHKDAVETLSKVDSKERRQEARNRMRADDRFQQLLEWEGLCSATEPYIAV